MNDETTRASVLIVDDTVENLQLLTHMLREQGHEARPAPSGKLALKAVENETPDLILLDIIMPEMNGYDVCRQLKSNEGTKEIPVIFISALDETVDKVEAFTAGGVDYVTKPFRFEEVWARVETHLRLRRAHQQLDQSYQRMRRAGRCCSVRRLSGKLFGSRFMTRAPAFRCPIGIKFLKNSAPYGRGRTRHTIRSVWGWPFANSRSRPTGAESVWTARRTTGAHSGLRCRCRCDPRWLKNVI